MEEFEEKHSDEHLILAEFLGLEGEEIANIEEESTNYYTYEGDDYEVYDQYDLDNRIVDIIESIIDETQWEINNRVDMSDYANGYFMRVLVDDDAIRAEIEDTFGYHMGNYENEYDEFNGYYIFKK